MNRIKRIKPATGAVIFRGDSSDEARTVKAPSVDYGRRLDLFAENALGIAIGVSEIGLGLPFGPVGVPLEVDGGLRLTQSIFRLIAAVAAPSDDHLNRMLKDSEVVNLIGLLTVMEKNLAAAITGDKADWKETTEAAEARDSLYKAIKALKVLRTRPSDGQELVLVSAFSDLMRGIETVTGFGMASTNSAGSKTRSGEKRANDRVGREKPPKEGDIGDFPEHIPKPGKDGTMRA